MNQSNPHFLLTIDVEDWFQVENFKSVIPYSTWDTLELRVERNVHRLLDLFDSVEVSRSQRVKGARESDPTNKTNSTNQTSATNPTNFTNSTNKPKVQCTFFVLGWIAERMPGLVLEIHARGHEVASHGFGHALCTKQSIADLKADLVKSKALLEDITGEEVCGYRAPSFSIDNNILKTIEDVGYCYDSSYNSFDKHGRYGKLSVKKFERVGFAYKATDTFYEIPISNLKLGNMTLPWGGGGYFRLIPNSLFTRGVGSILFKDGGYVFYMHPWEIDFSQPRVHEASKLSTLRHYSNLQNTEAKLKKLITRFRQCRFVTCKDYIQSAT